MARKRIPSAAGGGHPNEQRYNPYDADPYDPLNDSPASGKAPGHRDDASNENPQPRPEEPPSPAR
jgi:hypothetical protein